MSKRSIDWDSLAADYTSGEFTVSQIADKYGITPGDVQEYAMGNNLTHGSVTEEVRQVARDYVRNASKGYMVSPVDAATEEIQAAAARKLSVIEKAGGIMALPKKQQEVKARHRNTLDTLYAAHGMLAEASLITIAAATDPLRFHPADPRVRSAKSLLGEKESVSDMLGKSIKMFETLGDMELKHEGMRSEDTGGKGGVNVNVNVDSGGNRTAVDENSKLAALAGMMEMLEMRRRNEQAIDAEWNDL